MQVLRIAVVSGLLMLAGCSLMGRSHWYNPDPNRSFERDQQLSLQEAKQVKVTSLGAFQQPIFAPNLNQSFGQNMLRGLSEYSTALERETQLAQERAYNGAMANRGWKRISTDEARALGIIKP